MQQLDVHSKLIVSTSVLDKQIVGSHTLTLLSLLLLCVHMSAVSSQQSDVFAPFMIMPLCWHSPVVVFRGDQALGRIERLDLRDDVTVYARLFYASIIFCRSTPTVQIPNYHLFTPTIKKDRQRPTHCLLTAYFSCYRL